MNEEARFGLRSAISEIIQKHFEGDRSCDLAVDVLMDNLWPYAYFVSVDLEDRIATAVGMLDICLEDKMGHGVSEYCAEDALISSLRAKIYEVRQQRMSK